MTDWGLNEWLLFAWVLGASALLLLTFGIALGAAIRTSRHRDALSDHRKWHLTQGDHTGGFIPEEKEL